MSSNQVKLPKLSRQSARRLNLSSRTALLPAIPALRLKRWAQLASLLCSLVFTSAAAAQQARYGVLLVDAAGSQQPVISGYVTEHPASYEVVIEEDSKIWMPRNRVLYVGESLQDVYQYKLRHLSHVSIGDHFQLTRWCLVNNLLNEAAEHYQRVAKQRRDHPQVRQLGLELKKKMLEQPEFRQYLGLSAPPQAEAGGNAPALDAASEPNVSAAADEVRTASYTEPVVAPQVALHFAQKVQPILMNRCSQAACHGGYSSNQFKLTGSHGQAHARITTANLQSTMKFIETETEPLAPLIRYATTAHGLQKEAGIAFTETQLLESLQQWIQFANNPVMPAVAQTALNATISQDPSAGGVVQATTNTLQGASTERGTGGLTQVAPGAGQLRQVPGGMPTESEIDELDRQLREILGEPPITKPSAQGRASSGHGNAQAIAPHDPSEFNRRAAALRNE